MSTLISIEDFRAAARKKQPHQGGVFRLATDEPLAVPNKARTKRFCFSDGSVDRMGDTIAADGWDTIDFTRNPVALWAHDSYAPPIGRASDLAVEGSRLMGDIEFAKAEVYPFAETIFQLLEGGFLRAVSVGFIPLEYSFVEDKDRPWGIDFKRQTLLEISVCPIPANPNALQEARAKGIDMRPLVEWAEKALDGGGRIIISKAELERLRKAAKEPQMPRSRVKLRLRSDGASEQDPGSGGALVGTCGRGADDECGMKNISECSVHGTKAADGDEDEEKRLRAMLRTVLREAGFMVRREADDDDDEPPLAHEDAIRMAHKHLRTSKAFIKEAVGHHAKAMSLLDDVVDALNDGDEADPEDPEDKDETGETDEERAARAAQRRASLKPV